MANARLIADAPVTAAERDRLKASNTELLEALQTIRDYANVGFEVVPDHIRTLARAAIERAAS